MKTWFAFYATASLRYKRAFSDRHLFHAARMPILNRSHNLGQFNASVDAALIDMAHRRLLERIWKKDYHVWKSTSVEITNRLGWLTVAEQMQERAGALKHFARSVREAGFRYVVLLGMGGSSLGPEVLRQTFGVSRGFLKPFVLDSTVPGAIRDVQGAIERSEDFRAAYTFGTLAQAQSVGDMQFLQSHECRVAQISFGKQPALQVKGLLTCVKQGSQKQKWAQPKRERSCGHRA
jgi:hypothetical protein